MDFTYFDKYKVQTWFMVGIEKEIDGSVCAKVDSRVLTDRIAKEFAEECRDKKVRIWGLNPGISSINFIPKKDTRKTNGD